MMEGKGKLCKACGKPNRFQICGRLTRYVKPKHKHIQQKVNRIHDDAACKTHPELLTSSGEDNVYVIHTVQHSQQPKS